MCFYYFDQIMFAYSCLLNVTGMNVSVLSSVLPAVLLANKRVHKYKH